MLIIWEALMFSGGLGSRRLRRSPIIIAIVAVVVSMGPFDPLAAVVADAATSAAAVGPFESPENNAVDPSGTVAPPLQRLWRVKYQHYVDATLAADGLIFVAEGPMVQALDPSSGRAVWGPVDTCGDALGDSQEVRLTFDGGRLFASTGCGQLIALDAATGRRLWWHRAFQVFAGYGAVFVMTDDRITRLDERTGKPIWHFDYRFVASAAVSADEVVVSEYSAVWALRLSDGGLLWHVGGYTETVGQGEHPVIAGDRVVALDGAGPDQWVLNRTTGQMITTLHGDTTPVVVGDVAVVRSGSSFVGESMTTGAVMWTFSGDGHLLGHPVGEGSEVYLASSAGRLWALNAADGSAQWQGTIPDGYGTLTLPGLNGNGPTISTLWPMPMTIGQGLLLVPVNRVLTAYSAVAGAIVPHTAAQPRPALVRTTISAGDAADQQGDARHAARTSSPGLGVPFHRAWSRDFAGPVSYAVIGRRRVFAVSYANGHSYLHALDRRTGRPAWPRIDLGARDGGGDGGPCLDDQNVYVTGSPVSIAVNRGTGKVVWRRVVGATRNGAIGAADSSCTVSNGTLYSQGKAFWPSGGTGGMVFAIDPANGGIRWAQEVPAVGGLAPVAVLGDTVLLNLTHYQAGFDATTGRRLWLRYRGDGPSYEPAVAYDGKFWVLDDLNRIEDARTGERQPGFSGGPPAFYSNRMFLESDGELRCEDIATHMVIWRRHTPSPVTYPPFVVNRLVLTITADGTLHVYNLAGIELWQGPTGVAAGFDGGWPWPGAFGAGTLATISAADGTVVAPVANRLTAWAGT